MRGLNPMILRLIVNNKYYKTYNSLPKNMEFCIDVSENTTVSEVFSDDRRISFEQFYPISSIILGKGDMLPYIISGGEVKWHVPSQKVSYKDFAETFHISSNTIYGECDILEIGGFMFPYMSSVDLMAQIVDIVGVFAASKPVAMIRGGITIIWGFQKLFNMMRRLKAKFKKYNSNKPQNSNLLLFEKRLYRLINHITKKQRGNGKWNYYKKMKMRTTRKVSPLAVVDFIYKEEIWNKNELAKYLKISTRIEERTLTSFLYIFKTKEGIYEISEEGKSLKQSLQTSSYLYNWTEEQYMEAEQLSDRSGIFDKIKYKFHGNE